MGTKYRSSFHKVFPSHHNGQGYEGDEGHGSHEGHESHEEEVCEQDCQGPLGQGACVPWIKGKDCWWPHCIFLDKEQERQGCEQEAFGIQQEESLDSGLHKGEEGTGPQGLRCIQEGLSSLQEGQGVLQLNFSAWLQLRSWGYLQPSSAAASDWISSVEHQR